MKTNYDPKMTLKKAALMALPGAIGGAILAATAAMGMIQNMEGEITLSRAAAVIALAVTSILIGALTGGLRALENWVKNSGVVMVLFVAGACLCFSGCLTAGAPSRGKIALEEETPTEHGTAKFSLVIDNKGEITENTSFGYVGETDGTGTPWELNLNGNREVRSPQALALAQGQAEALTKLPDLLAPFIKAFNDAPEGEAGAGIREIIMQKIIETIMGRIGSGGLAGVLR